ncbi:hypothetical protein L596_000132 [Steinernema carpocapsae]|uniref:Uncharacterized protein n=1 Tax=Steinernema carpocapsae TaxID=34508 RepID=A0A4U8UHS0_STECR|nr:hypothetical protein L596_000132 [Steinernema carpocapsae]
MRLFVVSLVLLNALRKADAGRFITEKDTGETYTETQLLTLVNLVISAGFPRRFYRLILASRSKNGLISFC